MVTGTGVRIVARLLTAALIVSAGYAYAQLRQDFFGGVLRGEQGDPAELPPQQWPDRNVAGCHMLYTSVRREANGSGWRTDYPWGLASYIPARRATKVDPMVALRSE